MIKKLLPLLILLGSIVSVNAQSTIPQGGTGWATSTPGDLLVGTSSTLRYTRLPIGSTGQVLWVLAGRPAWVSTSSLGITGSGSGASSVGSQGSIQFASSSSGFFDSSTGLFWSVANSRLGIGTNTPTERLTVEGNVDLGIGRFYGIGGARVLTASSTDGSTLVGVRAGNSIIGSSTNPTYATAIGLDALRLATSSQFNTSIGAFSMFSNTSGNRNNAIGYAAMYSNTTGSQNTANGQGALYYNTTGFANTAMGMSAGSDFSPACPDCRSVVDTFASFFGYQASRDPSVASTSVLTNITAIGKNAKVGVSNALVLGGTSTDAVTVGIGTTTPNSTLTVRGTGSTNPLLIASSSGTSLFTVLANGNVGFSTSTPSSEATFDFTRTTGTTPLFNFVGGKSAGNGSTVTFTKRLASQQTLLSFEGPNGADGYMGSPSNSNGFIYLASGNGTGQAAIGVATATGFLVGRDSLLATSNPVYQARISALGQGFFGSTILIGSTTTNATAMLDIRGNSSVSNLVSVSSSTGSNVFVVSNSGNVGINVANPTDALQVSGNTTPSSDVNWSLGSSTLRFLNLFTQNVFASSSVLTNASTSNLFSDLATFTNSSTTNSTTTGTFVVTGTSNLATTTASNLTVTGNTSLNNTTISNATSSVHVFNTSAWLRGLLFDSTNSSGTLGQVLLSTGTSTQWVSTSSLGISGGPATLSGGAFGFVTRWLSPTTVGTSTFIDDGVFTGINASTTGTIFTIRATSTSNLNPLVVASSTGIPVFNIGSNGRVGIGSTTPTALVVIQGTTSAQDLLVLASTTNANLFRVTSGGQAAINSAVTSGSAFTVSATNTAGTALTIGTVTSGTGITLNTLTSGTGAIASGLTSGVGFNGGGTGVTTGTGFSCPTTSAVITTGSCIRMTGSRAMTADQTGWWYDFAATSSVTAAATRLTTGGPFRMIMEYANSGSVSSINNVTGTTTTFHRIINAASTGATSTIAVSSPLVAIVNQRLGTGTTSDSGTLLSLVQLNNLASGTMLYAQNQGRGELATFIGNGSFGIGTSTFLTGIDKEELKVDAGTSTRTGVSVFGNINDFFQSVVTNLSLGVSAESGFTAQNASSTATSTFAWFGINGPNFATSTTYSAGGANDVTMIGTGNNMFIVNTSATGTIGFLTGGTATTTRTRMYIGGDGRIVIGTSTPQSQNFGLTVATTSKFLFGIDTNVTGYTNVASTTLDIATITNGGLATTTIAQATTFIVATTTARDGDMFELRILATTTQNVFFTNVSSSTDLVGFTSVASGTTRAVFEYDINRRRWDLTGKLGAFNP